MQEHPYRGLPPHHFWKTAVAGAGAGLDPVTALPFRIGPQDRVAAAGSCFAQHIARNLTASGFDFLRTEGGEDSAFSARFGNVYTARQLRQLMLRAYGLLRPMDTAWQLPGGGWVDPFRPQMLGPGMPDAEQVAAAREDHLAAVRAMFEQCTVFIFTLGLTEAWLAADGAALPVPPGVLGVVDGASAARFHNFSLDEVCLDLEAFLVDLVHVNPSVRVILTVSPVALAATHEDRHVLVSNTLSKATLRLAAEAMRARHGRVCYFPSYEIVTAPANAPHAFAPDMRSVTEVGVARVMALFNRHMLGAAEVPLPLAAAAAPVITAAMQAEFEARAKILCDEELLAAAVSS